MVDEHFRITCTDETKPGPCIQFIFRPKFKIDVCELHLKFPCIWITQFDFAHKLINIMWCIFVSHASIKQVRFL